MAVVAGAVTVAACATAAAIMAVTASPQQPPPCEDGRRGGTTAVAEATTTLLPPAPSSRECAVCLSELEEPPEAAAAARALPPCGHVFHAECIGAWLPLRPECPLCRRPVPLAGGPQAASEAASSPAPAWARPARIACGFGDGRVVWTRSPSAPSSSN